MKIQRWGLDKSAVAQRETIFHTANGYIGIRANYEEGVPPGTRSIRGAYINAFYDTGTIAYGEKLYGFASESQTIVNIADVQGITLLLCGETFDPFTGETLSYEQTLDMEAGIYLRRVVWRSPGGRTSRIEFTRMASFAMPELFTIMAVVTPEDWSGSLEILSTQDGNVLNDWDPDDPRKNAERRHMLVTEKACFEGNAALMLCRASRSGMKMASAVRHTASAGFTVETETSGARNTVRIIGNARQGQPETLVKWCVFTDSRRCKDPLTVAREKIENAASQPIEAWYLAQRAALTEFWNQSRVLIDGDEALQSSIDYSVYSLYQSAGRDSLSDIASKGLSGEGYEGHYFWDTEIYMFPFFLLTNPEIARVLLNYRHGTLPDARAQARLMGHSRGALYPWRTIGGSECSAYFPSGSAQYHINGDIAHAFITYYLVTNDLGYMAEKGAEVLVETARLWLDAGHWLGDSFRIDCVTGPDEYTCIVNNNYYTNKSAAYHLRWTAEILRRLIADGRFNSVAARLGVHTGELDAFERASRGMYLPFNAGLGICAQDDSFLNKKKVPLSAFPKEHFPLLLHYHPLALYRLQVCKQADAVLAHFLFEEGIPDKVIADTYAYYEGITTHDSSLSPCVFSMMASRIGQTEKAYAYYRQTACLDLEDTHGNTCDGIHAANMGGGYMGIVFGFAGLRIRDDGLMLRPCVPEALKGYSFRIMYRGALLKVTVNHTEVTVCSLTNTPVSIMLYGREYAVPVTLPLQAAV
jgi:alpha,alpha-trehalose phosphorylase